eukprot:GHVS01085986.1.p1 GENE.GHVS01085986.1~~GHVS01085986.1.p1  ORF type:complete len:494 (+),score=100.49 GHVS01085986.1:912-2393(+)
MLCVYKLMCVADMCTPELLHLVDVGGQPISPVEEIAAGGRHALLLGCDGRVWSFGENRSGQCGVAVHHNILLEPRMVRMSEGKARGKSVAAGYRHSACITENNQIFLWGHSAHHKLIFTATPETLSQQQTQPGVAVRSGLKDCCPKARLIYSMLHQKVSCVCLGAEFTIVVTGDGRTSTRPSDGSSAASAAANVDYVNTDLMPTYEEEEEEEGEELPKIKEERERRREGERKSQEETCQEATTTSTVMAPVETKQSQQSQQSQHSQQSQQSPQSQQSQQQSQPQPQQSQPQPQQSQPQRQQSQPQQSQQSKPQQQQSQQHDAESVCLNCRSSELSDLWATNHLDPCGSTFSQPSAVSDETVVPVEQQPQQQNVSTDNNCRVSVVRDIWRLDLTTNKPIDIVLSRGVGEAFEKCNIPIYVAFDALTMYYECGVQSISVSELAHSCRRLCVPMTNKHLLRVDIRLDNKLCNLEGSVVQVQNYLLGLRQLIIAKLP